MKKIKIANQKGGVGKTSAAIHLAIGLALGGYSVLLVDGDAQGHCAARLGTAAFGGLYRLLVQEAEWKDVLREPAAANWAGSLRREGRLLLLPSNIETRAIPMLIDNPMLLRERLAELEGSVDVAIFDSDPTPSLLHQLLYLASDWVIYPTKCEMLSLDGLAKSLLHFKQQNEARGGYSLDPLKLLGVLPTMYREQLNAHRYGLKLLAQQFGAAAIWTPLKDLTVWRDCEYEAKSLFAYAPDHEATKQMMQVVERVAAYVQ